MVQQSGSGQWRCLGLVCVIFFSSVATAARDASFLDTSGSSRRLQQSCNLSSDRTTDTNPSQECCFPWTWPKNNTEELNDCVTIEDKEYCMISSTSNLFPCKPRNSAPAPEQDDDAPAVPDDSMSNFEDFFENQNTDEALPPAVAENLGQFFGPDRAPADEVPSDALTNMGEFFGKCEGETFTFKTKKDNVCEFPQVSPVDTRCYRSCFTRHRDADELVYDEDPKMYCKTTVGTLEECAEDSGEVTDNEDEEAPSAENEAPTIEEEAPATEDKDMPQEEETPVDSSQDTTTDSSQDTTTASESAPAPPPPPPSDDGGSNTLAIVLGVTIPCALVALAALGGGFYYWRKKKPQTSGFEKYEGEAVLKGGSISSKDITKPAEPVSKYATPI